MSAPSNPFKLGLFVILGIAAVFAIAISLGIHRMHKETVDYTTYFNEAVQGLDVGAPVKFRGVTIGHVADIAIAPDHRMVEVTSDLIVDDIVRLGLGEAGGIGKKTRILVPPDLRVQLGTQGITGVKFLTIDFFDPKSNPPPVLTFQPPDRYIPAATSLFKNLEETVSKAMDRLPELVDATVAIVARVDRLVAVLEHENVGDKVAQAVAHADQVLTSLDRTLKSIDRQNIPARAAATLDELHGAIANMNKVLDVFGEVGKNTSGATRDLDDTLRDVRDAADSIRRLGDALERDPDMLIKGRAKGKTQ
jgi:paraquat-inducible protein B